MTKFTLLLLFLFSANILYSQENDKYVYCEIISYMKGISGKPNVAIVFGQESKLQFDKKYLDESGQPLNFSTIIDAMNFMAKNGWEFVQGYVPVAPFVHYVLRKKIIEPKEQVNP